ncbi:hypothetical protein [Helcococcus ovis]|uniref:hypothetical protein n=1 Tax=Helcococcus ovis TaxID=72026 RepID=UPI0038BD8069
MKQTKENKLQKWLEIIEICNCKNINKSQWLKDHNIPRQTYYMWQRKLRTLISDKIKNDNKVSLENFTKEADNQIDIIKFDFNKIEEEQIVKKDVNYPNKSSEDLIINTNKFQIQIGKNLSIDQKELIIEVLKNA